MPLPLLPLDLGPSPVAGASASLANPLGGNYSGGGSSGGGQVSPGGGASTTNPNPQPTPTPNPTPSGATPNTNNNLNDFQKSIQQQKDAAAAAQAAREASIRGNIHAAYQPIYDELDRQVNALPGQRSDLETQVNTLSDQNKQNVQFGENQQVTGLDQSKQDEQTRTNQNLRDLSDNIRNLLQGASFYLGSMGSADSSATEGATNAITQFADKTRGSVLNTENQALTQLDRQVANVHAVAQQNLKQIDDYKTNKLMDIAQWATDQLNRLGSAKAQAGSAEGNAIAQLIEGTQSQFLSRLQQLDDEVNNYKYALGTWAQNRTQDLTGYLSGLTSAGTPTGAATTSAANQRATLAGVPAGFSATGQTGPTGAKGPTGPGGFNSMASGLTDYLFGSPSSAQSGLTQTTNQGSSQVTNPFGL